MLTDYRDPSTIDVDEVIANINHYYARDGQKWTEKPDWPNVTVKALADEITRLRKRSIHLPSFLRRRR